MIVKVDKYEFRTKSDGAVDVHRHGEPWISFSCGSKAIITLMAEIEDLRERMDRAGVQ